MTTFVQFTTIQGGAFSLCGTRRIQTYIRSGRARTKIPLAAVRGHRAPRADGTLLPSGMLQPAVVPVTHPTLESVRLFRSSPSAVLITPSEWRPWAPNLSRD